MGKYALIIGSCQYQSDKIADLSSPANDIKVFEEILLDKDCGDFDDVISLPNPSSKECESAAYKIFEKAKADDLILLYYSGHGIKDDSLDLYFATHDTEVDDQGKINPATAFPAFNLQRLANKCNSKYQVIILDCCYSGAINRDLVSKSIDEIDILSKLGGSGRAILASSKAEQESFEDNETGFSLYTKYLLEGIKSGEADKDRDGRISADELHQYAKLKLASIKSGMSPKIYAIEEGYNIEIFKNVNYDVPRQRLDASQIGLVLLGNIVDFSEFRGVDQGSIIDTLWTFLLSHNIVRSSDIKQYAYDGALDRFIFAFTHIRHQEILDFALSVINYMSSRRPSVKLRIGVHEGRFQKLKKIHSEDQYVIIGTGANECTRITRVADENNIILSEEFVRSWSREQGSEIYRKVQPSDPEHPIEFFSKRNKSERIYIYNPANQKIVSKAVPKRLEKIQIASDHIQKNILPEIADIFIDVIQDEDSELTWEIINPRVTIFVPDTFDEKRLVSTKYSYLRDRRSYDRSGADHKGNAITHDTEVSDQGPIIRAYKSHPPSTAAENGLPDYGTSADEYMRTMLDWGISEDQVLSMGRHSRAFIAFPFSLSRNEHADGVVCIDTLSDLSSVSSQDLEEVGNLLMEEYSLLIASLWHLRVLVY